MWKHIAWGPCQTAGSMCAANEVSELGQVLLTPAMLQAEPHRPQCLAVDSHSARQVTDPKQVMPLHALPGCSLCHPVHRLPS